MDNPQEPEILIEMSTSGGLVKASRTSDYLRAETQNAMNLAMSSIREMAYKVSRTIHEFGDDVTPNEVEVEFSLKLEFEGGVEGNPIVPLIAKTTTGGQFTVKFKWILEKPEQAKVLVSENP